MKVAALGMLLALTSCSEDGVSYKRDINPIFVQRCFVCHHPTSAIVDTGGDRKNYDFTKPFDPEVGIVDRVNSWKTNHPQAIGDLVVDPGNPDNSSLVLKISETEESIDPSNNGHAMPYQIPRLDEMNEELGMTEVEIVEQWIADGANDDEFFQTHVQPIFGTGIVLREETTSDQPIAGKCTYCHYEGSPTGLNVLNVFDPVEGMVNAPSFGGGTIVIPGDPDNSELMKRIRDTASPSRRMPKWYPRLSQDEVDLVVEWIEDGAKKN